MVKFNIVSIDDIRAAFVGPYVPVVDPEFVAMFENMGIGDIIEVELPELLTVRSFKVRVNKAAKEANKWLTWEVRSEGPEVYSWILHVGVRI